MFAIEDGSKFRLCMCTRTVLFLSCSKNTTKERKNDGCINIDCLERATALLCRLFAIMVMPKLFDKLTPSPAHTECYVLLVTNYSHITELKPLKLSRLRPQARQ